MNDSSHRLHITPIGDDGMYVLNTASWRVFKPIMNKDKCINCGICLGYCPVGAVFDSGKRNFEICYDYCKGCGICAQECPRNAIAMEKEE